MISIACLRLGRPSRRRWRPAEHKEEEEEVSDFIDRAGNWPAHSESGHTRAAAITPFDRSSEQRQRRR